MKTPIKLTLFAMIFCIFGLQDAKAVIAIKTLKALGDSCAEMRMFSGQTYSVTLIEISNSIVRYTGCPNSNGKVSVIDLTSIYRIMLADGSIVYQYKKLADNDITNTMNKEPKSKIYAMQQNINRNGEESSDYNVFSVMGFISSALYVLSLILTYSLNENMFAAWVLLLGLSGLVCSVIGLAQRKNHIPEKKGKDLAILGLILVALTTFIPLILLGGFF